MLSTPTTTSKGKCPNTTQTKIPFVIVVKTGDIRCLYSQTCPELLPKEKTQSGPYRQVVFVDGFL